MNIGLIFSGLFFTVSKSFIVATEPKFSPRPIPTTRKWNDGLFTHILRKLLMMFVVKAVRDTVSSSMCVLDDNKLPTLPNGERLNLPPNVRIMFEVEIFAMPPWRPLVAMSSSHRWSTVTTSTLCRLCLWMRADDEDAVDMPGRRTGALATNASKSANLATQVQIVSIPERYFSDWVKLDRIQVVGACNPPTDPGRIPLSHHFLRHALLVMVDYPGEVALKQIYGTYNRALLKVVPTLRAYAGSPTDAMIAFYLSSQKRFTTDIQAHYVYSPSMEHFPTINRDEALHRPILFSNWTSKYYIEREELLFYEEELDVPLVLFNDVLDHVLASQIITIVAELESKTAAYKEDYALLISEAQAIKSEMERVQSKVDRTDGGFFYQQYCEVMWQECSSHPHEENIKFKPEPSLTEYLSTANDRLSWQSKSLPSDNLTTENAIMLKRFNRYPLIIDPTGQATTFLLNEYKDRKITVTSFSDEAFLKVLESALRFGHPLLIQGRTSRSCSERCAGQGNMENRWSCSHPPWQPGHRLFFFIYHVFVHSRPFRRDICSRVIFVNFIMTRSSLQSQSLDQVLKVERPDTERKKTDLKTQGEFHLCLRTLEKLLLQALNESTGNIFDDDKVISTLETLKREAADITHKIEETDIIMKKVEQVTAEYLPLAQACSSVFFILEQLNLSSTSINPRCGSSWTYSTTFHITILISRTYPTIMLARDPPR
ncbi:ATP-binding dynein motor region D5-domain-containing protein [Suillus tomentosus]|nr:ATP-binding dynein motor region D5-domain-containing protein [Suillus tomentosus]